MNRGGAIFEQSAPDPAPGQEIPPRGKNVGKRCRRCGETRESSEFPAHARTSDGLSSWCRGCHAEAKRVRRRERRVEALLEEAAEREREAEAGGLLAASARSSAEALRREAERELAGGW
jgi:hypothetical protein